MAQEFTIKSEAIESKINQLLPSQGGFQPGVDFSASTMIIPIVDLTESAEGSALRQDLQTAISHASATVFNVVNATTTIVNTTGYWRLTGTCVVQQDSGNRSDNEIQISDGFSTKTVWGMKTKGLGGADVFSFSENIDLVVKLEAGDSLILKSSFTTGEFSGSVRQIADLSGNLVNP